MPLLSLHSLLFLIKSVFPLSAEVTATDLWESFRASIFCLALRRKDESKEPIVEVRTEDECTANHNAAGPTEPNETTPLTEPE